MASRAILRRRRLIDHLVNCSNRSILSSLHAGYDTATENLSSHLSASSSSDASAYSAHVKGYHGVSFNKGQALNPSGLGQYGQRFSEVTSLGPRDGILEFNTLTGVRWISQYARSASTATAKQPELGSEDDENNEMAAKKRKEASPEECDQAVEGLTTAKAKAKAKRLQEPQKGAQTVVQRIWAIFLGIGPALRAVASMSRLRVLYEISCLV